MSANEIVETLADAMRSLTITCPDPPGGMTVSNLEVIYVHFVVTLGLLDLGCGSVQCPTLELVFIDDFVSYERISVRCLDTSRR